MQHFCATQGRGSGARARRQAHAPDLIYDSLGHLIKERIIRQVLLDEQRFSPIQSDSELVAASSSSPSSLFVA